MRLLILSAAALAFAAVSCGSPAAPKPTPGPDDSNPPLKPGPDAPKALLELKGHTGSTHRFAFTRDSKTLATGAKDGTIYLWDVPSGALKATLKGHASLVTSLSFSSDGKRLGSVDDRGGVVVVWDVPKAANFKSIKVPGGLVALMSPDGKTLAVGCEDKTIKLWDVEGAWEKRALKGPADHLGCMAFSPDGKSLAVGSGRNPGPGQVKVWDLATEKDSATLKDHEGLVVAVAFSPDGKAVASSDMLGNGLLWEAASGKLIVALERGPFTGEWADRVAFLDGGKALATLSDVYRVWDATSGKQIAAQGLPPGFNTAGLSPDGKFVAAGSHTDDNLILMAMKTR